MAQGTKPIRNSKVHLNIFSLLLLLGFLVTNPGTALKGRGAREAAGQRGQLSKDANSLETSLSLIPQANSRARTVPFYTRRSGAASRTCAIHSCGGIEDAAIEPRAIFQGQPAVSCYQLALTAARGWRIGRWKEWGRKHQRHPLHLQSDFHYILPATLTWALIQHPIIWLILMLAKYLLLFTHTTANWVRLLIVSSLISKNKLLVLWPPKKACSPIVTSLCCLFLHGFNQSIAIEMTLCNLQGRPWGDLTLPVCLLGMFALLCKKTWPRR